MDRARAWQGAWRWPRADVAWHRAGVYGLGGRFLPPSRLPGSRNRSSYLAALDQVETLRELVQGQRVLNFTELESRIEHQPELGAYVGVFEADGDWLCADESGRCFWAGGEWLDDELVPSELDLSTILERYFEALVEQRHFRPV